jgi:hypothetical protein
MSKLLLSVSAIWLLLPITGHAEGAFSTAPLTVTEVGIFCPYARNGSITAPDTVMGSVDLIDDVPVDLPATTVPTKLELAFGARYRLIEGTPDQPGIIIFTHPPMGSSGITRQSWDATLSADSDGISTYRFDRPDEMVTGLWTMQIEIDGQRVLYQEFNIVPPAEAPTAIDLCFGGLTS